MSMTEFEKRLILKLDKLFQLKQKEIELKELEVKQQRFFIELIEEVLPLDDGKKRIIHQKTMRNW